MTMGTVVVVVTLAAVVVGLDADVVVVVKAAKALVLGCSPNDGLLLLFETRLHTGRRHDKNAFLCRNAAVIVGRIAMLVVV